MNNNTYCGNVEPPFLLMILNLNCNINIPRVSYDGKGEAL